MRNEITTATNRAPEMLDTKRPEEGRGASRSPPGHWTCDAFFGIPLISQWSGRDCEWRVVEADLEEDARGHRGAVFVSGAKGAGRADSGPEIHTGVSPAASGVRA